MNNIEVSYNPLGFQPVVGIYVKNGFDGRSYLYFFEKHDDAKELCEWAGKPENQKHIMTLFTKYLKA